MEKIKEASERLVRYFEGLEREAAGEGSVDSLAADYDPAEDARLIRDNCE